MQAHGEYSLSVPAFVDRLARVFEKEQSFRLWSPDGIRDADSLSETNQHNAWKALLNELFNGRRATSLSSMGLISFEYTRNDPCDNYDLPTFLKVPTICPIQKLAASSNLLFLMHAIRGHLTLGKE